MGQISVSVKIDPTRGRGAMNARKYKIRKEVDLEGGPFFHLRKKKKKLHGKTSQEHRTSWKKVRRWATEIRPQQVLGLAPRSSTPRGTTP